MTTVAIKFIEELKQGQISEAIETIKASLHEMTAKRIDEAHREVLSTYGFSIIEKKMETDSEDDDDDDMEDSEDDDMEDDKDKED